MKIQDFASLSDVPDTRVSPQATDEVHPLRGAGFVLGVKRAGAWIGYCLCDEDMGYTSAAAWMRAGQPRKVQQ